MTLTLPPDLQPLVDGLVRRGRYPSPGAVLRGGLALLKKRERLRRLFAARLSRGAAGPLTMAG